MAFLSEPKTDLYIASDIKTGPNYRFCGAGDEGGTFRPGTFAAPRTEPRISPS